MTNRQQFQGELFPRTSGPTFEPVPSVRSAFSNVDFGTAKKLSTQDRYRVAQFYERDKARVDAGGAPSKRLVKSYDALRSEIPKQYESLTSAPGAPRVNFVSDTGYASPREMNADMRRGNLDINSTRPDEETVVWDNTTNNQFRAVHDMVGHGAAGASFSPEGESQAADAHRMSMPKAAHRAVTAEVLGQASSYEFNGGNFVDQKGMYNVPTWAVEGRSAPRPPRKSFISRAKQGTLPL